MRSVFGDCKITYMATWFVQLETSDLPDTVNKSSQKEAYNINMENIKINQIEREKCDFTAICNLSIGCISKHSKAGYISLTTYWNSF